MTIIIGGKFMAQIFIPSVMTKETKDFVIYNVVAYQTEHWSEKELQEILKNYNILISLKEVKEIINEFILKGLLTTSYENKGRDIVYKWNG